MKQLRRQVRILSFRRTCVQPPPLLRSCQRPPAATNRHREQQNVARRKAEGHAYVHCKGARFVIQTLSGLGGDTVVLGACKGQNQGENEAHPRLPLKKKKKRLHYFRV